MLTRGHSEYTVLPRGQSGYSVLPRVHTEYTVLPRGHSEYTMLPRGHLGYAGLQSDIACEAPPGASVDSSDGRSSRLRPYLGTRRPALPCRTQIPRRSPLGGLTYAPGKNARYKTHRPADKPSSTCVTRRPTAHRRRHAAGRAAFRHGLGCGLLAAARCTDALAWRQSSGRVAVMKRSIMSA